MLPICYVDHILLSVLLNEISVTFRDEFLGAAVGLDGGGGGVKYIELLPGDAILQLGCLPHMSPLTVTAQPGAATFCPTAASRWLLRDTVKSGSRGKRMKSVFRTSKFSCCCS